MYTHLIPTAVHAGLACLGIDSLGYPFMGIPKGGYPTPYAFYVFELGSTILKESAWGWVGIQQTHEYQRQSYCYGLFQIRNDNCVLSRT